MANLFKRTSFDFKKKNKLDGRHRKMDRRELLKVSNRKIGFGIFCEKFAFFKNCFQMIMKKGKVSISYKASQIFALKMYWNLTKHK